MTRARRAAIASALALAASSVGAQVAPYNTAGATGQRLIAAPQLDLPDGVSAVVASDYNVSTIAVSDLSGGPFWPGGPRPVTPGTFTWPGGATSAGILGPNDPRYAAGYGKGYDGVARLLINTPAGTFGCTGALIDATHILAAAHCVSPLALGSTVNNVTVGFLNSTGGVDNYNVSASGVNIMGGYTGSVVDAHDLSVLTLDTPAAPWITRYGIYLDNPLFKPIYEVGFGSTGNGVTGAIYTNQFDAVPVRRVGLNMFDLTRDASFLYIGNTPVTPILVADFDGADPGGTYAIPRRSVPSNPASLVTGWAARTIDQNNVDCNIWNPASIDPTLLAMVCDKGFGLFEGLTGSGDSGGPAFILGTDGKLRIAGVTSFGNVACFPDQRMLNGVPSPRTDSGCPTGFVRYGSRFGMRTGHVFAGGDEQYAFIKPFIAVAAPEPATFALLGTGLLGLGLIARARRKN